MSRAPTKISDLQADELRERFQLSRNYAWELLNRPDKQPSLDLAVRIEREYGVPTSAWLERKQDAAA